MKESTRQTSTKLPKKLLKLTSCIVKFIDETDKKNSEIRRESNEVK